MPVPLRCDPHAAAHDDTGICVADGAEVAAGKHPDLHSHAYSDAYANDDAHAHAHGDSDADNSLPLRSAINRGDSDACSVRGGRVRSVARSYAHPNNDCRSDAHADGHASRDIYSDARCLCRCHAGERRRGRRHSNVAAAAG